MDAATDEGALAGVGWTRRRQPLPRRRALAELVGGGLFVVAAVALAVFGDTDRSFELGTTLVLVLIFVALIRLRIDIGITYTTPLMLAFVPMLFLLPTQFVPLLVLLSWTVGRLPDLVGDDRMHPDRLLLLPGDSWFSFGPALVLVVADAETADPAKWPVYLLALAAQFTFEGISIYLREWAGLGSRPPFVVRELLLVYAIDALLAPLGLLAALASDDHPYAFILLVPPAFLLTLYARERTRSLERALALSESARDREALIAGASHELVTPLGVLVGLTSRLVYGGELTRERRSQLDTVMRREVIALRHVVRQFVDYTRLKTERDLQLRPEPTQLDHVAAEIVIALTGMGRVGVTPVDALPPALVDPDRAHQMVMSVAAEALEGTESVQLALGLDEESDRVELTVTSPQPLRERPFAEGGEGSNAGLGLYVTRELARRQGGELVALAHEGGARYVLSLPVARG